MAKFDEAAALQDCLECISKLDPVDRKVAEQVHAIVVHEAPELLPRTWYSMPAYALPEGPNPGQKVVVFFQAAGKFKTRYHTVGFSEHAKLDQGSMWPNAYALSDLDASAEATLRTLVRKAIGR